MIHDIKKCIYAKRMIQKVITGVKSLKGKKQVPSIRVALRRRRISTASQGKE